MIQYKVGQEVYHARFGRGVIQSISEDNPPIITVDFSGELKDLVFDKNLLMRMTIRGPKDSHKSEDVNASNTATTKSSFFSSLVLPDDVEIKQFEGMDRFHFKYKDKGFLVIDLRQDSYQLRTREEYLKAIGIVDYKIDNMHPTNPAKVKNIPYSDTQILKKLINYISTPRVEAGINQGKAPLSFTQQEGKLVYVCPTCQSSFKKAKRCPECGQLILHDAATSPKTKSRILHVGDDISRLRIYEIINKYFGKDYSAWMKASYEINDRYWAWFPTITKTNTRPNGTYGGTAMWSNTLTPDRKTVISVNHDELNKIPKELPNKRVLIFGRIDGFFYFLGVFNDYHVPEAKMLTYQHDRLAKGIDLDTFQLIDED